MNGLPCVCLQDAVGTSASTLLPDTPAILGIIDSKREQVLGQKMFNCKDPI